jgi:CheY-like chemotaxis protein
MPQPGTGAEMSAQARPAPGAEVPPEPVLQGTRIMVVEHDQETRETLVLTLQEWGAAAIAFGSVGDAVSALDDVAPDAVMVAIRMPGDPYRFIAAMRRRDGVRRRHTPLLAIVGSALDRRRAASAGIHLHMARPLDPARLRLALVNLVHAGA